MPLPNTRKAPPSAPTNQAQGKTKSRLPALPQQGLKTRKQFAYLNLPQEQDRCFYLVKCVDMDQFTSDKTNTEKFKAVFTVLDTNASGVRAGSESSILLSLQGEGSLYFWNDFAPMVIALAGGEVSDETLADFVEDREATYGECVEKKSMVDAIARVEFQAYAREDGSRGSSKSWYPATDAELAKYKDA